MYYRTHWAKVRTYVYINLFTVYYVKSIPFAHNTTNRIYTTLSLENKYVAVDPAGSTFLYKPEMCTTKNTVTMCNPAMIEIHKEAQTCVEALPPAKADLLVHL